MEATKDARTVGVVPCSGMISSAAEAAARAVEMSAKAAAAGTFGVGGLLMDRFGRLLAEATNAVVVGGEVHDPTAHVERQLVDWAFAARARGQDIRIEDLVIVSSLDPCAMCAGAILSAGMSVVAVAEDEMSGVNSSRCSHRLPQELFARADKTFGFFRAPGRTARADHISPLFCDEIPASCVQSAERNFVASIDLARANVSASDLYGDAAGEDVQIAIAQSAALRAALGDGLFFAEPGANLAEIDRLGANVAQRFDDRASLIVDAHGTIMLGAASNEGYSPARSSVLELARAYVRLAKLLRDAGGPGPPNPRHCSIVRRAPPSDPARAVLEFGALGSFFEAERPSSAWPAYAWTTSKGDESAQRFLQSLPPLYTSVIRLTAGPVPSVSAAGSAPALSC